MENIFNPVKDYNYSVELVEQIRKLLVYEDEFFNNFEGFKEITPLFRFSNENITEYYKLYNFKDKDVLTVIGSGDQALSAIYQGAKKVDVFDINKLSFYLLMLKKYAITSLSYDEFITFFNPATKLTIIDELYKKISKNIKEEDIKLYWDLMFKNSYYFYFLFIDTNTSMTKVKKNIPYLKYENEYNRLKNIINDVNFNYIGGDLNEIINSINSKYDYINLSNIIDYIDDKNIVKSIYTRFFNKILKKNGMCLLEYEWQLYACYNDYIFKLFKKHKIEKHEFNEKDLTQSSAYIYKKTKK